MLAGSVGPGAVSKAAAGSVGPGAVSKAAPAMHPAAALAAVATVLSMMTPAAAGAAIAVVAKAAPTTPPELLSTMPPAAAVAGDVFGDNWDDDGADIEVDEQSPNDNDVASEIRSWRRDEPKRRRE